MAGGNQAYLEHYKLSIGDHRKDKKQDKPKLE